MRFRKYALATMLLIMIGALNQSCTEESGNIAQPPVGSGIVFKDVRAFLQKPSQVQFTFRVSDSQNHAVLIDASALPQPFRIFEDNAEIDYSETSYFVHPAASLELDMVVLLDFTNSMATWQENGKTGIGLEVDWTRELIDQLAATHRMAIMEYHDRNVDAGLIAPFSGNKDDLHAALDRFLLVSIDHGSSRIWDAVYSAVDLFDGSPSNNKQRTVFVITDGRETSSDHTPADVIAIARQWQANVFIVGAGNVANEAELMELTARTGGEYYPASDIESFRSKLQQIMRDLGGQYKLSYITLKRTGSHDVQVLLEYEGLRGSFDTTLDLGSIYGDDRMGVITFDQPTISSDNLSVVVRAQHIPRNIDRFRFRLETTKPCSVAVITAASGGLCEGWNVSRPDTLGFIDVYSTTPLRFGDFGPLFQISIGTVIEASLEIPFIMDNSIYSEGKTFNYPERIVYGSPGG